MLCFEVKMSAQATVDGGAGRRAGIEASAATSASDAASSSSSSTANNSSSTHNSSGSDSSGADFRLTPQQLEFFDRNGYLTIPGWWDAATCTQLAATAHELVRRHKPETVSVFSTHEQARTSDEYFLTSGDKVRCFFEERAFNPDGSLKRDAETCINKIGHNLHELVPEFRRVSFEPRVAGITRSLGYRHPLVVQSMLIFKQPGIGGEVRPHVDGAFLYTEPQTCLGMWVPLEDCTQENGCLWAVPGSHRTPVRRRFKRNPDGPGTLFDPPEAQPFNTDAAVPLEITAGTLVLIHNSVVHFSEANNSSNSRLAYSIHLVEGAEGTAYPKDNWLQRFDGKPFPALY